jgi:hypothetical protein
MAINAYPIVTGGATRQYDQNIVRLISRSNASLVVPEIYKRGRVYLVLENTGANKRRTYLRQRQSRRRRQQKHLAEDKDRAGVGIRMRTRRY